MPLSYARWSELELSEDEEDAPAPSSAIGREGARADTQERFDTVVANQQKRPVREQLCPGPRSEEDLLKEQEEFFARQANNQVSPAATLARKPEGSAPGSAHTVSASKSSKPLSKFARESLRRRDAAAAVAGAGAHSAGHVSNTVAPENSAVREKASARQREAPAKPVGEPMSVVDMQIKEKDVQQMPPPMAPCVRATPAPIAQHRSQRATSVGDSKENGDWSPHGHLRAGSGRQGGEWKGMAADVVSSATCDEDWVSADRKGKRMVTRQVDAGDRVQVKGGRVLEANGRTGGGGSERGEAMPDKSEIHAHNVEMLRKMSKADIAKLTQEVEDELDGALLQKIRERARIKQRAASAAQAGAQESVGMDRGGRGTEGPAIGLGVKKSVSFGHNAPSVGNVVTGIPAAVAQELHQDGQLCNLPAPSDDDIAKMQWMGDVEIEADSDDDRADDDAGAQNDGDKREASTMRKLAKKKVEGLRFDFDGKLTLSGGGGGHDGLHHHADNPAEPGYTIPELTRLSRSAFSGQRTLAIQTLAAILERVTCAGPGGQLLLEFLLEMHVVVLARCALDDKNLSHMAAGARLVCALLTASYAALPLDAEQERQGQAGPDLANMAGLGAGGWSGGWAGMVEEEVDVEWADIMGVKGNDVVYFETPEQARAAATRELERSHVLRQRAAQGLGVPVEEEEEDVASLAQADPVRGLLGMNVLPKITALLHASVNATVECVLLQALVLISQHSPFSAAEIYNCPGLLDILQTKYIDGSGVHGGGKGLETVTVQRRTGAGNVYIRCGPECRARILVMKLLRFLALSSRTTCICLHRSGIFEATKQHLLLPFGGGVMSGGDAGPTPAQVRSWLPQQLCLVAGVLACWRATLEYGVGAESFADLSLHLQAFTGFIAGSTEPPLTVSDRVETGNVDDESEQERATELVATMTLRLAQTALLLAAAGDRSVAWNTLVPWLGVAQQVGHASLHCPSLARFLQVSEVSGSASTGGTGKRRVKGLWVAAVSVEVMATHLMCLERMLATGATDLRAAKTMAANICTEFFSRARLSPDVIEVEIGQKGHWGTLALQSLLHEVFAGQSDTGDTEQDSLKKRGSQELTLSMLRLLRGAVQLLMLSDDDVVALCDREAQRQRQEDAAAEEAATDGREARPRGVGVLQLGDLYTAGTRWAAARRGGGCELVSDGIAVIDKMMHVVVSALPLVTEYVLRCRRGRGCVQARDGWHGRSTILLHVELLSLAACCCDAAAGDRAQELMASAFACVTSLGPGDETIVLRIVDGILLPHACAASTLLRVLSTEEIFHLGGKDSGQAAEALRDYYLHMLKRLLTSEGDDVLPLSIAAWTHNHTALLTLARPLQAGYLPLPADFLFLPLQVALKGARSGADAHLAMPEFRRAASMALVLLRVLLDLPEAHASTAALLSGRGGPTMEGDDRLREFWFCRCASVFLLGSDVYLSDNVAPFLRSTLNALLRPSWKADREPAGTSELGLTLEPVSARNGLDELQIGKLFAALASQFTQDSLGDITLAQILLLTLQPKLVAEWRIQVWECLSPHYLNLLRCHPAGAPGGLCGYLHPPEDNVEMLHNYRRALESGHVKYDCNPFLFALAVHHLSSYIFSPVTEAEGPEGEASVREAGRQMLRALILAATPAVYLDVCAYVAPAHRPGAQGQIQQDLIKMMQGQKRVEVQVPFADKARWVTLVSLCAHDDTIFAKVRKDGGVLGEEAFRQMQRERVC